MKINKNKLNLVDKKIGVERVEEITKNLFKDDNILPKPITYDDIHKKVIEFIKNDLEILNNNQPVKTFFFTQQRMSEFTNTWEMLDDNKNIIPDFKIVTRENNPQVGTLFDGSFNIPGDTLYEIAKFEENRDGKNIIVSYKMKQPYTVDIIYTVKFVTNKLNLSDEFNNKIINKFKSKQEYLYINGHYMSINLEEINDESDYGLEERKILSQSYKIRVKAYIINQDDMVIEEIPTRVLMGFEVDTKKAKILNPNNSNYIKVEFPKNSLNVVKFKSNDDYHVTSINTDNLNVLSYKIIINGSEVENYNSIYFKKNDRLEVKIERISRSSVSHIDIFMEPI